MSIISTSSLRTRSSSSTRARVSGRSRRAICLNAWSLTAWVALTGAARQWRILGLFRADTACPDLARGARVCRSVGDRARIRSSDLPSPYRFGRPRALDYAPDSTTVDTPLRGRPRHTSRRLSGLRARCPCPAARARHSVPIRERVSCASNGDACAAEPDQSRMD